MIPIREHRSIMVLRSAPKQALTARSTFRAKPVRAVATALLRQRGSAKLLVQQRLLPDQQNGVQREGAGVAMARFPVNLRLARCVLLHSRRRSRALSRLTMEQA
jgi:hypothetical protein